MPLIGKLAIRHPCEPEPSMQASFAFCLAWPAAPRPVPPNRSKSASRSAGGTWRQSGFEVGGDRTRRD